MAVAGMFSVTQTIGSVLCCKCGILMPPNAANMCANCLRSHVDITEGLQKRANISYCPQCERYRQPPTTWIKAQLESKELLTLCLKSLNNLNTVRIVDAHFIWTEPHSKRIKIKLRVQKEVLRGAILEQAYTIEYDVHDQLCQSCLPPKVAASLGNLGPLLICHKVSSSIALLDPFTLRQCFLDAEQYWRSSFQPLLSSRQLREYIVLDVELVSSEVSVGGSRYTLADAHVARVSDFGKNDRRFIVRTHLGNRLSAGDYALGYDLYGANINDMELEKYKNLNIPDVILIKKSYGQKRQGKSRSWKLKSLNMEVDHGAKDKMNSEYEQFLRDIEENPDLRFNLSLYRNNGEEVQVPLEELLADLDLAHQQDSHDDMEE
ncbi:LOW QUALITY PROTEIN: uncharacterized protein LOC130990388 [Salvia miltiorrhiza]|uniref:LOW QUALITY PROTEIN: uncharacterized protein LOC130990388 n=1 Tax=Salvia miltiorrhiza TaxID=226208 RepID=UPI0025AD9A56|nr:LOW QUALITY PROTEIN: uncharacterized protein LOC130990388 [Salvia miltiorrhiza]